MYALHFHIQDPTPSIPQQNAGPASSLEILFPRLARDLTQAWQTSEIDGLLRHLIFDDRGDRAGFPLNVIDDLMFLADLRWTMRHLERPVVEGLTADREYQLDDFQDSPRLMPWQHGRDAVRVDNPGHLSGDYGPG